MDGEAQQIIEILKQYLGDSAGLFFLREEKEAGINESLMSISQSRREGFAQRLCDNLLSNSLSPQKISVIKSRFYSILDLDDKVNKKMDIEGKGWN